MRARLLALLAIAALATACGSSAAEDEIDITLDEWAIGTSVDRFVPGRVTLAVENRGEFPHTLIVEGPDGAVAAATDVIPAGAATTLDLDLDAAQYRFTCRIVAGTEAGTVVDHFQQGMVRSITAGA